MAARIKMTSLLPRNLSVIIRPVQYRDLDGIERITQESFAALTPKGAGFAISQMQRLRRWYGLLKFLSWFPNPLQYRLCAFVAEQGRILLGMIQVSPFNRTRSTWRIDRVLLERGVDKQGIGSQLLRHCFESILEARTWLLEVNINDIEALALYRQNGFQRLAEMTYWEIGPELLAELAQAEPDLPNLLPISNADAQLLYQLDTASMPPLVRQVFDRNTRDFKTSLFGALTDAVKQWLTKTEVVSGYVFEPQRKAAIGYFQVQLDRKGEVPHAATLTVHPAYTWLYPELLSQLARIAQDFPQQGLQLASSDYQAEREEYLERIGAKRIEHTLVMSRSVWHKLRESKFVSLEGIQWTDMLQGLQPTRKPIPGGMSWIQPGKLPSSDKPLPIKPEPINFPVKNPSIETSPITESADGQQEK
ncbi:MAG: GNAT family N-acetyltransferase [Nostoc sp. DedQUE08]|uniref:GNAT family N-acetyltransferase n=1 Tax=unclassified Nostoc TaxID=2593658 RepID=UPI002AD20E9F|nr:MULTISPECIES: GNAT family N-acetyltransferase [unclassified Nostoc]MDZ8033766.1 GNAT family N-acetyltransferase [Nostoc sp. DedSLP04]MDZ8067178.1 GNAT family N-acetyltransferase [Nostoc sp. DedQUE08]MDZ8096767.1 GNAT family N-acetyltransferase [Nostoc sp. DedQUE05]MDZ8128140.1 GNAT family N-acetyltransferase [Nostoc sp. DedQUE07]